MHGVRRWSERLWAPARTERGSAPFEFLGVGLILLVPLAYLVVTLGAIQQQTLGAEDAARHAARAMAQLSDAATAKTRTDAVLASVVTEYRMPPDGVSVQIGCTPQNARCPEAGALLMVHITTQVRLPF